jgi:hypothetical protein
MAFGICNPRDSIHVVRLMPLKVITTTISWQARTFFWFPSIVANYLKHDGHSDSSRWRHTPPARNRSHQ